jgi:hypothetical protein
VKDVAKVRSSLAKEINLGGAGENQFGAQFFRSADGEFAAAFVGDFIVVGDTETVIKCLEAKQTPGSEAASRFAGSNAVALTIAYETATAGRLIDVFSEPKDENQQVALTHKTETRFNRNGMERRTISDFGLIGSIIEQFAKE